MIHYIISYRNAIILRKKNIELANIAAINIHPGPPKYRGVGCLNYALYNNEKTYGFTIHLIEEKIDGGQILYVKNFLINKNSSVESLLDLTHKNCLKYSTIFFKSIFKDSRNLDIFKKNNKNIKWSKIIKSRKDLNNFYRLNKFDVKEVEKKIRATNYKNYKPFIKIKNYKFILE